MINSSKTIASQRDTFWTEYGIPIRNIWYMLLYAWNEPPLARPDILDNIEEAPTLDALLAAILVKLVQQRLRIGLGRNYVDEENILRGIRGHVNFNDSLKRHTFEKGQAYCEFLQYGPNVPKNQIIRSTINRLVKVGQFGPDSSRAYELRHNLRWLTRVMEGVDLIELKPDFIRRQQLGRNDRDYRLMLAICELLLQHQMPTDSSGRHNLPALVHEALFLPHVYERFVANYYRINLAGWKVTPQKHLGWHQKQGSAHLPVMQPDLVLENKISGQIFVLDTKFTAQILIKTQWENEVFNSSHLYQLYAYLKTQEHVSDKHRQASGILLYPDVNQTGISEIIELQNQTIRIESVDLTLPWQNIEKRLLDLISRG